MIRPAQILRALDFAIRAHDGQRRKYTNEPYIVHPIEVAGLVERAGEGENAVVAALLHDVVEDTKVGLPEILRTFGPVVAQFVHLLTDPPSTEPRAVRKAATVERLRNAGGAVQTIKVADLIDNTPSILAHDRKFAAVYLREKAALLDVLEFADWRLRETARGMLAQGLADLARDSS